MKVFLSLILGILFLSTTNGQERTIINNIDISNIGISSKQSELIFDKLKHYPNQTQLSIAIIQNGKPHFVGFIKQKDTITTCNNYQHIFEVGSITKIFTATLLANLVLQEKVSLETSVQDFFDFKLKIDETITLKQLANHTSGLPRIPETLTATITDINNPFKDFNESALNLYLTHLVSLNFKPGSQYLYSNLGVGLLGFVLAKTSNSSYENLLQHYIFKKYGLTNSTSQQTKVKGTLVSGRDAKGKKTANWDFDVLAGAGAILSSTEDLTKFALAQFNPQNKELLFTQQPTFVINSKRHKGLGWIILKIEKNQVIWHNGRTGGYTSSMALDTQHKNGIIILSNLSGQYEQSKAIDNLCFGLIRTLN